MRFILAAFVFGAFLPVSSVGRSETIEPNPQQNKPTGGVEEPAPKNAHDAVLLKQVDMTTPAPNQTEAPSYFYPYNSSVSLSGGLFAANAPDGTFPVYDIFGASYLWESLTAFHIETGFSLTAPGASNGDGQLWAAARWLTHFTEKMRPYTSVGLGIKLRSERGLANFVAISNYMIRGAVGFEYSFFKALSVKAELFGDIDPLANIELGPTIGVSLGL